MSNTVSDFAIERLHNWGIKKIFGYPGDGINGLMGALERAQDKVEFIQVRHEEMAAFMACGYAKFSGEVGVCMATSGPGAIHLLNGLYDANMDHQPVVAIIGQQQRAALGGDYQQEVDLTTLFKDVAKEYVQLASSPTQIRHLIDRAVRIAQDQRTVTCVIIPADVQEMEAQAPPRAHGTVHSGIGHAYSHITPIEEQIKAAADILNQGKKIAILIGSGARHAQEEILQVADLLGAGIAKALLGKDVLDDTLPFVTGAIGLLGTKPSWDMMMDCDTFLMIGSSFPYSEFLPEEGQAKGIQIDIDGRKLSLRFPMDINLKGDAKSTLTELIPYLQYKQDRSWREKIEKNVADWWQTLEARAMNSANPLNPQRVFWELSPKLPYNVILTSDSGSSANWYARDLKIRGDMRASLSGNLATMGPGVPYAIAAKFAHPDRPVIACVGDGAMQMNGMLGLITLQKYVDKWQDKRLIILILNNSDLNQVTWEQRVMLGDPKFEDSQTIPNINFSKYAELLGFIGIRVDNPNDVAAAWDKALSADRPVIFEAMVDPNVPPLPPHITLQQAYNFMSSIVKGDPNRVGMIKQAFKDGVEDYIH